MNQIRLLLIEDDITDQMSFRRFVKHQQLPYGYDIAGSVAEAIDLLTSITKVFLNALPTKLPYKVRKAYVPYTFFHSSKLITAVFVIV